MPYIGKQPLTGAYQLCDAIVTSATATYNLLVGGSGVIPGSANNCIVSLNGVVQAPVGAFTVSGSTITFASTLSATDVIDFILILGNVFDIGTPTNGAVTNSSLNSNVITGQTAETTVAGGDLVLLYDDSASALRKMTRTNFVSGLANTPAFFAYSSTNQTISDITNTKVTFNSETLDTDNCFDTTTNYRFTPTTAGKYFCFASTTLGTTAFPNSAMDEMRVMFFKNGSKVQQMVFDFKDNPPRYGFLHINNIIEFNGSSDYLEVFVFSDVNTGTPNVQANGEFPTYFGAYKLIGV